MFWQKNSATVSIIKPWTVTFYLNKLKSWEVEWLAPGHAFSCQADTSHYSVTFSQHHLWFRDFPWQPRSAALRSHARGMIGGGCCKTQDLFLLSLSHQGFRRRGQDKHMGALPELRGLALLTMHYLVPGCFAKRPCSCTAWGSKVVLESLSSQNLRVGDSLCLNRIKWGKPLIKNKGLFIQIPSEQESRSSSLWF